MHKSFRMRLVISSFLLLLVLFSACSSKDDTTEITVKINENLDDTVVAETTEESTKEASNLVFQTDGEILSNGQCLGTDKPFITNLPMDLDDFSLIIPYGLTVGAHVTPIDHQYFTPMDINSERDAYPVYAMADASIVDIGERVTNRGVEYRLVFSMSCSLFYYYDLVTSLTPDIMDIYQETEFRNINIPVKAGQLIGHIGGQTLDFAVWDMDVYLDGFVVPEHYDGESWKIHTADPLNYYTDSLKDVILSKYIRTIEPVSGKIDYDIDGKLVGNWFEESHVGYIPNGLGGGQNYWVGHLSFVYDIYDPTSIVISIGDYSGEARQFGVKYNAPDPSTIDPSSGVIIYELVQQDWIGSDGFHWDRFSLDTGIKAKNHEDFVDGILLVQMLDDRRIQIEVFPNQQLLENIAFTSNAKIYVR